MKKDDISGRPNKTLSFWFCAGLIAILLASIMARDIDRPFYGLHSWGEAGCALKARNYLKYNIKHTKGFAVWSVGNPPIEPAHKSLDHPQLGRFLPAVDMMVFGADERGLRIGGIIRAVVALLIFLKILQGLLDEKTALLSGLIYALFPVTSYFGTGLFGEIGWDFPLSLLAIWCYLVLIRATKDSPEPQKTHKWLLAASLFIALQISWCGFFYAAAIGIHYVFHCIHNKKLPDKTLLALLIFAPFLSLALDFVIMSIGFEGDWKKIISLYTWRSSKGELQEFLWALWFKRLWEFATTNFTLPVLLLAIIYLTFGQLFALMTHTTDKAVAKTKRRFPQFWLFLMPAAFQLLALRGSLWKHQFWEYPLAPFIAIATALAIMLLSDILRKINRHIANTAVVLILVNIFFFCTNGLN